MPFICSKKPCTRESLPQSKMVKKFLSKLKLSKNVSEVNKPTDASDSFRMTSSQRFGLESASVEKVKSLALLAPTPSMTMLSEASEALSYCPTALKKLADGSSSGGVYQVSAKQLRKLPSKTKLSSQQPATSYHLPNNLSQRSTSGSPSRSSSGRSFTSFDGPGVDDLSNSFDRFNLSTILSNNLLEETIPNPLEAGKFELKRSLSDSRFSRSNSFKVMRDTPADIDVNDELDSGFLENNDLENDEMEVNCLRKSFHRKRSFSASYINEVQEEVRAVTSNIAIFKPEDEETGYDKVENASNDNALCAATSYVPNFFKKSCVGRINPSRKGLVIGGGARRERAAYMLENYYATIDRSGRFQELFSVPPTLLTKLVTNKNGVSSVRRGSLQRYVSHISSAEEAFDLISAALPIEIQKIAILDMRIFNTDRHGGNILCQKVEEGDKMVVKLIPIDHALSLPDWRYLSEAFFDWQYYPQSSKPLEKLIVEYVESINVDADQRILEGLGLSDGSIATNKISTLTLKSGVRHRLCLKDLAAVFCRPFPPGHAKHDDHCSPLEMMIKISFDALKQRLQTAADQESAAGDGFMYTKNNRLMSNQVSNAKLKMNTTQQKVISSFGSSNSSVKKVWPTDSNLSMLDKASEAKKGTALYNSFETEFSYQSLYDPDYTDHPSAGSVKRQKQTEPNPGLAAIGRTESLLFDLMIESKCKNENNEDAEANILNCEFELSDSIEYLDSPTDDDLKKVSSIVPRGKDGIKIKKDYDIEKEENVFGSFVPGNDFYQEFQTVLDEHLSNNDWRKWVV